MSVNDPKRVLLREMLISIRKQQCLTQSELAHKLGKPQSYISKYESGERKLDVIDVIEVVQSLNMSPSLFLRDFCSKMEKIKHGTLR